MGGFFLFLPKVAHPEVRTITFLTKVDKCAVLSEKWRNPGKTGKKEEEERQLFSPFRAEKTEITVRLMSQTHVKPGINLINLSELSRTGLTAEKSGNYTYLGDMALTRRREGLFRNIIPSYSLIFPSQRCPSPAYFPYVTARNAQKRQHS